MNVADLKKTVDKLVEIGIHGPSRMPPPKAKREAEQPEAAATRAEVRAPVDLAATP